MTPFVGELVDMATEQEIVVAPLSPKIALIAGLLNWDHRDPFDRILAATALAGDMDFISADVTFGGVRGLRRIW